MGGCCWIGEVCAVVSAVWIADCWWGEGESEGVAEGSPEVS